MKTDEKMARAVLGMPRVSVIDLSLRTEGRECDTWGLTLARNVPGWGKKGSSHLFPVPHEKDASV